LPTVDSSQDSQLPHGVVPPLQLLSVPLRIRLEASSWPVAGSHSEVVAFFSSDWLTKNVF
jgi:hypothetical protein